MAAAIQVSWTKSPPPLPGLYEGLNGLWELSVSINLGNKLSIKISAPKYEEKSLKEEYSINPQELLGSGQFGQVYGGICKANNQSVAIKVIDKTRFKEAQAETSVFQNEITILYNIQHPGIVKLMALFDEVDNVSPFFPFVWDLEDSF